jgi:hypothetical protein
MPNPAKARAKLEKAEARATRKLAKARTRAETKTAKIQAEFEAMEAAIQKKLESVRTKLNAKIARASRGAGRAPRDMEPAEPKRPRAGGRAIKRASTRRKRRTSL